MKLAFQNPISTAPAATDRVSAAASSFDAQPPEAPARMAKGDLGAAGLPAPDHSFESVGLPFSNLRQR